MSLVSSITVVSSVSLVYCSVSNVLSDCSVPGVAGVLSDCSVSSVPVTVGL